MSSITFDHSASKLSTAMGISQDEFVEIEKKTKKYGKLLIQGEKKSSEIAQQIAEELSYTELVFFSTSFVIMSAQMARKITESKMGMMGGFLSMGDSESFSMKMPSKEKMEDLLKFLKGLDPDKDSE